MLLANPGSGATVTVVTLLENTAGPYGERNLEHDL